MSEAEKKQPNPIDAHVGSRIRLRRNILGMSQERLGENLGISFQQIQKYERGLNRVGAGRLQNIADILNVSVSFFFEDISGNDPIIATPHASSLDGLQTFLSSSEGFRLNREFVKIADPNVRRRIIEMVKALAVEAEDT
ncbi:helix-turn-helix domain-containing protein [Agrobacterium tumefaciens]|uniref:helix-turn-helix domain-containing protein n=1 Tax=Agrobacterium tumefaciens TaxID=358 RepID=UPI001574AD93|nr:helix-turn-helix transcriptional regulator [Agrobacterium tumefaciens]NTC86291.1 helix-turn-helix transcriptional regulator [Agrobacterium tumefaciens]NTD08623.1 helix-turn-helix transcriptional regulator [Agrobacterium tumefaciens]NTD88364.1 helix-turn-helix transcriptional regulator [Agrobacterium tumefaciens]NTD91093.1 helix-turn-helix transcriptional regulator [Agrobacterium tumefaciens]NTD98539.1 helix-turn-helix transcriptional regulator [Agrobacterium tumefaciens]